MAQVDLKALLDGRLSPEAQVWLQDALGVVAVDPAFYARWSAAGRRLGRETAGPALPGWALDEVGRVLLLLAALDVRPEHGHVVLVDELYRTGELRERQAVVRGLGWLPRPQRFTAVAIEAVRGNVVTLLEAIGCDNAYPAAHLENDMFNQMILKMLFNELPLARVVGLSQRRTAELVRMVEAYARERRAAGRPVPPDAVLVTEGVVDAPV